MKTYTSMKHTDKGLSKEWQDSPPENEAAAYGLDSSLTDWTTFLVEDYVIFFNSEWPKVIEKQYKIYYKKNFKTYPPGTVISFIQE